VEYVSAAHPHTLQEQQQITNAGVLLSLAVRIGKTRLIDNILLGTEANEHEKS
jgi:pantoate--beta-alanine ligase